MAIVPTIQQRVVRRCVLAFAAPIWFALGAAGVTLLGCGNSPCEDAVEKICAKACECGECGLGLPSTNENVSGSLKLFFSDEEDCVAATNCDDTTASDEDFEACSGDIGAATCEEGAVILPESCAGT